MSSFSKLCQKNSANRCISLCREQGAGSSVQYRMGKQILIIIIGLGVLVSGVHNILKSTECCAIQLFLSAVDVVFFCRFKPVSFFFVNICEFQRYPFSVPERYSRPLLEICDNVSVMNVEQIHPTPGIEHAP